MLAQASYLPTNRRRSQLAIDGAASQHVAGRGCLIETKQVRSTKAMLDQLSLTWSRLVSRRLRPEADSVLAEQVLQLP